MDEGGCGFRGVSVKYLFIFLLVFSACNSASLPNENSNLEANFLPNPQTNSADENNGESENALENDNNPNNTPNGITFLPGSSADPVNDENDPAFGGTPGSLEPSGHVPGERHPCLKFYFEIMDEQEIEIDYSTCMGDSFAQENPCFNQDFDAEAIKACLIRHYGPEAEDERIAIDPNQFSKKRFLEEFKVKKEIYIPR